MSHNGESFLHPPMFCAVPQIGPAVTYYGAVLGPNLRLISPDYKPDHGNTRELHSTTLVGSLIVLFLSD
jgi:hypothetical protein